MSVAIAVALLAVGCNGKGDCLRVPIPEYSNEETSAQLANVDLYFDATPSVMGYTADPAFVELVTRRLPNAVPSSGELRLFKLSSAEASGLSRFDSPTDAGSPGFYSSGDTDLGLAVDSAALDRVTVLITDLFQTDQDVTRLNRSIARKYLSDDYAVALVGGTFRFEGTVYDVGLDRRSFPHKGLRPLFMLVLGRPGAVRDYVRRVGPIAMEGYDLVVAPKLLQTSISAPDAQLIQSQNLVEATCRDAAGRKLIIRDPRADDHVATYFIAVDFFTGLIYDVDQDLSVEWSEGWFGGRQGSQRLSPDSGVRLRANTSPGRDSLLVRLLVDPADLVPEGLYRYDFTVRPSGIQVPDWVGKWDLDPAGEFDGSKTQYLSSFVGKLSTDGFDIQQPELGTLTLLVENPD